MGECFDKIVYVDALCLAGREQRKNVDEFQVPGPLYWVCDLLFCEKL